MQHPFEHWTKAEAAHTRLCFFHACNWGNFGLQMKPRSARYYPKDTQSSPNQTWYGGWKKSCTSWIGGLSMFIPLFIGFQPSKVVQDFFHPHYVSDSTTSTTTPSKKSYYLCHVSAIMGRAQYMRSLQPPKICKLSVRSKRRTVLPTYGSWASVAFLGGVFNPSQDFHWMAPLVFSMCWMNFMNMTNMFFWLVVEPPLWKILVSWGYYSHF